ncbi:unnamed protein product [Kuraishia capsulata CBS 1993]|uniref:Uncharacterized protein n=1 Tax=Kuraishia capsulata CBS 1993 TaxID=1382522 RepID=W6MPD5_9ASCO|nr:uncharacterized protein KUCA_T00002954001 [Kuraishia capsulata CBS 1993]CDK26977.1 unnamed protein product [Kuraishia capsulata CBS 1993]
MFGAGYDYHRDINAFEQNDDDRSSPLNILSADTVGSRDRPSNVSDLMRNGLNRRSSVIMAETGKRVQRTFSFFDDRTTNTSELLLQSPTSVNEEDVPYHHPIVAPKWSDPWKRRSRAVMSNPLIRGVLKASLAYFMASLAVYCKPISRLLGSSDSKHLVCTVVVYFPATRTLGSMIESIIFVVMALSFAFSVSVMCSSVSSAFYNQEEEEICYGIDLIISCSTLGMISFMKQRVNTQNFNTACSLAAISLISCLIKDGSRDASIVPWSKIQSLFLIVSLGCVLSVATCYLIWPTSAEVELRQKLNETCDILSSLLRQSTNKFLRYEDIDSPDVRHLTQALKKNTSSLTESLHHAKFELVPMGKEMQYHVLDDLVSSSLKLAMDIRGLMRSVEMQWNLLQEKESSIPEVDRSTLASDPNSVYTLFRSGDSMMDGSSRAQSLINEDSEDDVVASKPKELFDLFVYYLGPSMKSFAFTMRQILDGIPFDDTPEYANRETSHYSRSLLLASELFQQSHSKALGKLYEQSMFKEDTDFKNKIDQEEVAASCGNFSEMLLEFSRELDRYLTILNDYKELCESEETSYDFLKFWKRKSLKVEHKRTLNEALSRMQGVKTDLNPKNTFSYRLWSASRAFQRVDIQFGLRVGLGAFAIALFAFLDKTRDKFDDWRGEWALVTYCIIMNKSLGGTTMTVKWRFLGTFIGALSAYLIWDFFEGNVYGLALAGWLMCLPCFYIILYWKENNAFGRFILLTYNLTVLYSYTMSLKSPENIPDYDDEGGGNPIVFEIAFHRFIGVSAGVLWAIIMTLMLFPNSARSRIRRGLSLLWLRMGIIWNSDPLSFERDPDTSEYRLVGIRDTKMIHHIMSELEVLLKQAPKEIRLKGPFPTKTYEKLLKSTSKVIDVFENLNVMIDLEPLLTENERVVLNHIKAERAELENRVFLIFYMIASAMRLGFPLVRKPASTENAKDRMLAKLSDMRNREDSGSQMLKNEDFVLFYSYTLITTIITDELDKLIYLVGELFGVVAEDTLEL